MTGSLHTRSVSAAVCRRLATLLLFSLISALAVRAAAESPGVREVLAVSLNVGDVDRAAAFYQDVLDFKKVSEREQIGFSSIFRPAADVTIPPIHEPTMRGIGRPWCRRTTCSESRIRCAPPESVSFRPTL